jgi:hypothetical protein
MVDIAGSLWFGGALCPALAITTNGTAGIDRGARERSPTSVHGVRRRFVEVSAAAHPQAMERPGGADSIGV